MEHTSYQTFINIGFLSLLVIFSIQACGVFQTRKAQPPQSGDNSMFIQPDQPDIVISNLQNAIKSLNTQNYLSCFSGSFTFTPTVASQQSNPGLWNNWGKPQEQIYFDNLKAAALSQTNDQLQLSNEHSELQSETTAEQFTADYTLTVVHNRSSNGVPTVASGRLVFIIEADSFGLWHITSWTDISQNSSFTWSDMKAAFFKG